MDNQNPSFHSLLNFPGDPSENPTFGNISFNKKFELSPSIRPYATHTPQHPPIDTNCDVPLQTVLSASNGLISTYPIGHPHPNVDPPI